MAVLWRMLLQIYTDGIYFYMNLKVTWDYSTDSGRQQEMLEGAKVGFVFCIFIGKLRDVPSPKTKTDQTQREWSIISINSHSHVEVFKKFRWQYWNSESIFQNQKAKRRDLSVTLDFKSELQWFLQKVVALGWRMIALYSFIMACPGPADSSVGI